MDRSVTGGVNYGLFHHEAAEYGWLSPDCRAGQHQACPYPHGVSGQCSCPMHTTSSVEAPVDQEPEADQDWMLEVTAGYGGHAPEGKEHTEAYPYCSMGCCGMPDHAACPEPHDHHPPYAKSQCPECARLRKSAKDVVECPDCDGTGQSNEYDENNLHKRCETCGGDGYLTNPKVGARDDDDDDDEDRPGNYVDAVLKTYRDLPPRKEAAAEPTEEDWARYRQFHDGSPCDHCGTTIQDYLRDETPEKRNTANELVQKFKTSAQGNNWCAVCSKYITPGMVHDSDRHDEDRRKREQARQMQGLTSVQGAASEADKAIHGEITRRWNEAVDQGMCPGTGYEVEPIGDGKVRCGVCNQMIQSATDEESGTTYMPRHERPKTASSWGDIVTVLDHLGKPLPTARGGPLPHAVVSSTDDSVTVRDPRNGRQFTVALDRVLPYDPNEGRTQRLFSAKPTLKATLPDGRVVTRQTARSYTHVVAVNVRHCPTCNKEATDRHQEDHPDHEEGVGRWGAWSWHGNEMLARKEHDRLASTPRIGDWSAFGDVTIVPVDAPKESHEIPHKHKDGDPKAEDEEIEKTSADATPVSLTYCHPHRRWEWDCPKCGHGSNNSCDKSCRDCGFGPVQPTRDRHPDKESSMEETPSMQQSESLLHRLIRNRGFAVHVGTNAEPPVDESGKRGFMVAIPGYEEHHHISQITPDHVRDYMHRHAAALAPDNVYLGGWHDPQTDEVYFDVSEQVRDHGEARRLGSVLARLRRQLAIYDLDHERDERLSSQDGVMCLFFLPKGDPEEAHRILQAHVNHHEHHSKEASVEKESEYDPSAHVPAHTYREFTGIQEGVDHLVEQHNWPETFRKKWRPPGGSEERGLRALNEEHRTSPYWQHEETLREREGSTTKESVNYLLDGTPVYNGFDIVGAEDDVDSVTERIPFADHEAVAKYVDWVRRGAPDALDPEEDDGEIEYTTFAMPSYMYEPPAEEMDPLFL